MPHNSRSLPGGSITRRAALQLGAGLGLTAVVAPRLGGTRSGAYLLDHARPAFNAIPTWPVPAMISRAQWGADERLRKPGQVYDTSVAKIVVHHTGTPNDITNYAGLCRGILANETAGEYIDIAYNWLIDPKGRIYEGRWAQDYGVQPHAGEAWGANVRGGHASYHNARTIGVALMGNYDSIDPPPAMIDALVTLLAWKCARWGLDPLGRGTYSASNGAAENLYNICGHRDTGPTACPGGRTEGMLPAIRTRVAGVLSGGGYWIASSRGQVVAFGGVPPNGGVRADVVAFAGQPSARGYWLCARDGAVFSFGTAGYHGGRNGRPLSAPIIGMAPTPTGKGYWLVGRDGGVFSFGDASFQGSTGARQLNSRVLGMLPTPTGKGYWLYAGDGGVFSFGDARFMGSTGGRRLNKAVVSMAARPQGDGYWLVASDGGVFTFGNAPFLGSGATSRRSSPCVAMLPSTTGRGYVLLWGDGAVSAFGDAPNLGGAAGRIAARAIGISGRLKPF